MSINSWPPYIYFPGLIVIVIVLTYSLLKTVFQKGPMIYIIMYLSLIFSMLCVGVQKVLHIYWTGFKGIAWIFDYLAMVFCGIFILLGFVGVFKYGDEKRKKNAKWFLVYFVAVAIFLILLLLLK